MAGFLGFSYKMADFDTRQQTGMWASASMLRRKRGRAERMRSDPNGPPAGIYLGGKVG